MNVELPSPPRYRHVVEAVFRQPWAILPEKLEAIAELVQMRVDGFRLDPQAVAEIAAAAARAGPQRSSGATAVIPLYGTLMWRVGGLEEMSGATSLQRFGALFDQAMGDERIKSIVLDVDSPGGQIDGVPETAAKIAAARGQKPVTAVINTLGASAAYWLASAAEELVVTPSGMAGSVGVYMVHEDMSQALAAAGVKMTFVQAPQEGNKTEGNSYEPLSPQAQAHAQSIVDEIYGWFVRDLARFRSTTETAVREQFGGGRVFLAKEAKARGMVDRVATLEEVLARHGGSSQAVTMARAEAEAPPVRASQDMSIEDQRLYLELLELTADGTSTNPEEDAA